MKSYLVRPLQLLAGLAILGLLVLGLPVHVAQADGERQGGGCSGYYYTVKRGDTWSVLSRRVGLTITELKRANPQAVRSQDVIYAGERVCIPSASQGGDESGGHWYQVKPGDTWNTISRATGVPVRDLWNANPGLLNRRQWLYIGQRVWIPEKPAAPAPTAAGPASATTPAGANPTPQTGAATAEATPAAPVEVMPTAGVPTADLPPAAEASPTLAATPVATATPTDTPWPPADAAAATAAAAPSAAPTSTAPATATPTPAAAATSTPSPTAGTAVAASPTALPPKPADCPATLADYDAAVAKFLNNPANSLERLNRSLGLCRVALPNEQGAVAADITGAKSGDIVVVINDADPDGGDIKGRLLVYHQGQNGYELAHKRAGQGKISLIRAADVNKDGKVDLVSSDTSCGAHTCFGTLTVESWDGKSYADWIEDEPTIAEPEYSVKEMSKDGQGDEIVVHGGVIASVGAGPQRGLDGDLHLPQRRALQIALAGVRSERLPVSQDRRREPGI